MILDLIRSTKMVLVLAALLCGMYPAAVWVAGKLVFPEKAGGGILYRDGRPIGARLIGQAFSRPEYFQGRPSAAGEKGYDAANSSGSNLGPTNKKLADRVGSDVERLLKENPGLERGQIPTQLVTASGSGLDPHVSPEAAMVQVERVAGARGMDAGEIRKMVAEHVEVPQLGILGESVVNVLLLNLDLDRLADKRRSQ